MSKRVSFAAEDVESEVGVDSDPELQPEQSSQNKYRGSSRRNAISLGSGENLAIISRSRRRRFSVNLLENDNDTDREIDGNEGLALKDDKTYHHESDSDLSPTVSRPEFGQEMYSDAQCPFDLEIQHLLFSFLKTLTFNFQYARQSVARS